MIARDPSAASAHTYDLLLVGGGVHGVCLMREAASRGLSVCLCEAADFGSGASWNSLRILHGGLRYLQDFNLRRFRQSVVARRQWQCLFPGLVKPLRCLLPLDGRGLRNAILFSLALSANDLLTRFWSAGVQLGQGFPSSGVLRTPEGGLPVSFTTRGRSGFAAWYDGLMVSPERMLMEMLNDACRRGSTALNYCHVSKLLHSGRAVHGALVHDRLTGRVEEIRARKVIDCSGVSAGRLDAAGNARIARPVVAANLLLDLAPHRGTALAVYADGAGGQVFFLVPCHGMTMAGTTYAERPAGCMDPSLSPGEVEGFKQRLEAALPGHGIREARVVRVFSGLLPAQPAAHTVPLARECLYDHGRIGGVRGLYSLIGVKYTTAIAVATWIVDRLFPGSNRSPEEALRTTDNTPILIDPMATQGHSLDTLRAVVERLVRDESVCSLEDLVCRRTSWAFLQQDAAEAIIAPLLPGLPLRVPA